MSQPTEYSVRLTADQSVISLLERSQDVHQRILSLCIDRHEVGDLSLLAFYPPGIGVGKSHVVIWANTDLYVVNRATFSMTKFYQGDALIAAFPIDHRWCLVRELSVVMADLDRRVIEEEYDHDEVILYTWWVGNHLFIEDFEQRQFSFEVSTKAPVLRRREPPRL